MALSVQFLLMSAASCILATSALAARNAVQTPPARHLPPPTPPPPAEEIILDDEDASVLEEEPQQLRLALDVAFPNGGNISETPAAGATWHSSEGYALGASMQISRDKQHGLTSWGLTARALLFLNPIEEISPPKIMQPRPFLCTWLALGRTHFDHAEDIPEQDDSAGERLQMGTALTFGVEIPLTENLSTSVETGVSANIAPAHLFSLTTMTSQIALHYFFTVGLP